VRLHDLRHSFASFLVNDGISLYVVQGLLGHANVRATQRYAHLANDTLSDAAEVMIGKLMLPATKDRMLTANSSPVAASN
jgi:integrase